MIRQTLLTGLLRLIAALPLPLIHTLGAGIGWLLWRIPNAVRRLAARNLVLCFPELTPDERNDLLRRNLIETGKSFLELGPLWRWPGERVLRLVQGAVAGEETLAAAVHNQQGAILITPHLGA